MDIKILKKDQRGFIAIQLFTIMIVIVFAVASLLIGTAFAARKNAVMTYDWFSAAMDFAATAANRDKDSADAASRTNDAWRWFGYAFSQMTDTTFNGGSFTPKGKSIYPGPIKLNSFTYNAPGQPVPGGTAQQPGYTATIEVPVIGGDLPFIGPQYVTVPMRYFGVIKSQTVQ